MLELKAELVEPKSLIVHVESLNAQVKTSTCRTQSLIVQAESPNARVETSTGQALSLIAQAKSSNARVESVIDSKKHQRWIKNLDDKRNLDQQCKINLPFLGPQGSLTPLPTLQRKIRRHDLRACRDLAEAQNWMRQLISPEI
jgi:hypothetical protein